MVSSAYPVSAGSTISTFLVGLLPQPSSSAAQTASAAVAFRGPVMTFPPGPSADCDLSRLSARRLDPLAGGRCRTLDEETRQGTRGAEQRPRAELTVVDEDPCDR